MHGVCLWHFQSHVSPWHRTLLRGSLLKVPRDCQWPTGRDLRDLTWRDDELHFFPGETSRVKIPEGHLGIVLKVSKD